MTIWDPNAANQTKQTQAGASSPSAPPGAQAWYERNRGKVGRTYTDNRGNVWTIGQGGLTMSQSGGRGVNRRGQGGGNFHQLPPPVPPSPPHQADQYEQASQDWAKGILTGDLSNLPEQIRNQINGPDYDPTADPVVERVRQNMLRDAQTAFNEGRNEADLVAEGAGRFGLSDAFMGLAGRNARETSRAYENALGQLYLGSIDSEKNRRTQLRNTLLGLSGEAANIPLKWGALGVDRGKLDLSRQQVANEYELGQGQLGVQRSQVAVQRGQLGLARQEFNFNRQMALANAQQDALNDYFNILSGIGGLGGSQWGNQSQNNPTQPAWLAALQSGYGGYLDASNNRANQVPTHNVGSGND